MSSRRSSCSQKHGHDVQARRSSERAASARARHDHQRGAAGSAHRVHDRDRGGDHERSANRARACERARRRRADREHDEGDRRGEAIPAARAGFAHRAALRARARFRVGPFRGAVGADLDAPPSGQGARGAVNEALGELRRAKRVAIVSHRDPDPDTIGSAIALGLGLESIGKTVSLHCADSVPEPYRFLVGAERFVTTPPPADVDLVVTVDFGSIDRAKFALPSGPRTLNIDHHASNDHFAATNCVDVSSAASAELVSRVIDALGARWTSEMATAALVGIMTDTGSFQFPSTDRRALDRAGILREAGADLQAITYNIYRNKRFESLKLWGL